MAMTAWAAKFCTSSICLSRERAHLLTIDVIDADQFVFLEHRHREQRSGAADSTMATAADRARDKPALPRCRRLCTCYWLLHDASGRWPAGRSTGFAGCAVDNSAATPCSRDGAECVFFIQNRFPNLASQMRVAFSSIVSNTGCSSPGELLMTFSTSEVAVCCSSDSLRSSRALPVLRRTAGCSRSRSPPGRQSSVTSSICLSVKARRRFGAQEEHSDGRPSRKAARRGSCGSRRSCLASVMCIPDLPERRVHGPLSVEYGSPTTASTGLQSNCVSTPASLGERRSSRRGGSPRPVGTGHGRHVCLAQSGSRFDQRIEHCLQIECRAADDLSTSAVAVCCCSDFGEIIGSVAQFVEQPRILDSDHGLSGEV